MNEVGGGMIVLAIDPGKEKCGVAVVDQESVLWQQVLERNGYLSLVGEAVRQYSVDKIILGDGTGSADFLREIKGRLPEVEVKVIDEKFSSEEARKRYWLDHRPSGFRRILPTSMQLPPEPYDDYVAVILAERFLAGETEETLGIE